MPPTTSRDVTLQCPRADGTGASFVVYTLAQFDDQRLPVSNPLNVAVQSRPELVSVQIGTYNVSTQVFTPAPSGKDVKLQTIAPKPPGISSAVVRIRDGRTNPDGTFPEFLVNVALVTPPAVPPTIELVTEQPVVTLP